MIIMHDEDSSHILQLNVDTFKVYYYLVYCTLQITNVIFVIRLWVSVVHMVHCRLPGFEHTRCSTYRRTTTQMNRTSSSSRSVLFLCLGNICRSPTAEAVFRSTVEKHGATDSYTIDSCGTGGGASGWYKPGGFSYHEGDPADPRMTSAAAARGVRLTSRSRPLRPSDVSDFDVIVCMDDDNVRSVNVALSHWIENGLISEDYTCTVTKMTNYLRDDRWASYDHVPDPYYGGSKGFELVLDLLDDACEGLFDSLEDSST